MIMSIRSGAKLIIKDMLDTVIERDDLSDSFFIRYNNLAEKLGLESAEYCHICCQYMDQMGYIKIIRNDNGARLVQLRASGIDFLEST